MIEKNNYLYLPCKDVFDCKKSNSSRGENESNHFSDKALETKKVKDGRVGIDGSNYTFYRNHNRRITLKRDWERFPKRYWMFILE